MPKLAKLARDNADLAERFLVVAVHEQGPGSPDEARRKAEARQDGSGLLPAVEVPPVVVVDRSPSGMFHRYGPQGLGDEVLLDPDGRVVEVDDLAIARLGAELSRLRTA